MAFVCFLCGYKGKTEPLRTVSAAPVPKSPVFPWLRGSAPAPGAAGPSGLSGDVQACHLCAGILISQWRLHEKRKVPHVQRQYWSKSWCSDMIFPSLDGPTSESTSVPSPSPTPSLENPSSSGTKCCVLCSKRVNSADSKEFRLVNRSVIANILPETVNFPNSELPVCTGCFETSHVQLMLKTAAGKRETDNTPPISSLITPKTGNYEQAALLYQLMLQQMSVLQAQQTANQNPASNPAIADWMSQLTAVQQNQNTEILKGAAVSGQSRKVKLEVCLFQYCKLRNKLMPNRLAKKRLP